MREGGHCEGGREDIEREGGEGGREGVGGREDICEGGREGGREIDLPDSLPLSLVC